MSDEADSVLGPQPDADQALASALAEYQDLCARGQAPSTPQFAQAYPALSRELLEDLRALEELTELIQRPEPARRRFGDFEVAGEIGRGGMGIVYEARQISLARRVALKVLRPVLQWDSHALERFRRGNRSATLPVRG
jgi:hypothetical protein